MTRKRTSENELTVSAGATSSASRRKPTTRATRAKRPGLPAEPEIAAPQAVANPTVAIEMSEPGREEIARLAYLYWEARGGQGGSPEEDWLQAEQELRLRANAATA